MLPAIKVLYQPQQPVFASKMLQPENFQHGMARSNSCVRRLRIQTDYSPTHLAHTHLNLLVSIASFVSYHKSLITASLENFLAAQTADAVEH